jgi:cell division protein FtsL
MLHHEAKTHDDILKYYYERNDNSLYANHPLDELLESLIGMSGNKEIYISRMRKDLYIDIEDHPYFDHERTGLEQIDHSGKININGITFYENGGYMAQLKAEEERQEQNLSFRKREVEAFEGSAKYAKIATIIACISLIISIVSLKWTNDQTTRNDDLVKNMDILQDSLSKLKQEVRSLSPVIKTKSKKEKILPKDNQVTP